MQELVDGEWQYADGVSDQARTRRQQQLMLSLLGQLTGMRSPAALAGIVESVGDSLVLSESLSMGDAVAMVWGLRSRQPSTIRRIVVPTESVVMDDGSFALRALAPFRELLEN